jgi:hypothetical protein
VPAAEGSNGDVTITRFNWQHKAVEGATVLGWDGSCSFGAECQRAEKQPSQPKSGDLTETPPHDGG